MNNYWLKCTSLSLTSIHVVPQSDIHDALLAPTDVLHQATVLCISIGNFLDIML